MPAPRPSRPHLGPPSAPPYARYEVVDMDGDDNLELVLLRSDPTEAGLSLADYYDFVRPVPI